MTETIASPEQMRQAVADYVTAIHRAYLASTAGLAPEAAKSLPLPAAGEFSVLAVGVADLHLIATAQALAPVRGREVETCGELGPLRWRLRFYDPVVVPELASLSGPAGPGADEKVRRTLGLDTWLYHLVASPGAGLSSHNALHAGAALAHGHSRDARGSAGGGAPAAGEIPSSGDRSSQLSRKSVPRTENELADRPEAP
jgi:hypothetical protein